MKYATLVRVGFDELAGKIDSYASVGWTVHTLLHIPGTALYTILFERQTA